MQRALGLIAAFGPVALIAACNARLIQPAPASDPFAAFERPTRVIPTASGGKLAMYCGGRGRPLVLLESGAGGSTAQSWYRLFPLIARRTRVCAYDRAGFGFSKLGTDLPRDLNHDLDDLHDLLHDAGEPGPVVLVGHSMGGMIAAAYADRFPKEVAGLVLIEPVSVLAAAPDSSEPTDAAQRARVNVQLQRFNQCAERFARSTTAAHPMPKDPCLDSRDFDSLSPAFAQLEAAHEATPDYWRALASETESEWMGTMSRQAAAFLPHRWESLPVRIVSAAVSEVPDSSLVAALGGMRVDSAQLSFVRANHRNWENRQAALCTFSEHCIVTRVPTADHYVQNAAPDAVAAVLTELVASFDFAPRRAGP